MSTLPSGREKIRGVTSEKSKTLDNDLNPANSSVVKVVVVDAIVKYESLNDSLTTNKPS